MEIFNQFGVRLDLLAAQIVNFLLLLFILKRFLYKPILKVLQIRQQKIKDSLKNAAEIEKRLNAIAEEREKKLHEAGDAAQKIIDHAAKNADQIIKEARESAEKDMKAFVEKSRKGMELEKEQMYAEIRAKLADLVVLSFEKVASKILTEDDHKELIKKSVKEISL